VKKDWRGEKMSEAEVKGGKFWRGSEGYIVVVKWSL
jgi:hypothetical protein